MPADKTRRRLRSTAEEYYHGYGCTISSRPGKRSRLPRSSPTASKRQMNGDARQKRARRNTQIWMLQTAPTTRSAGTTTCWPQGVVPVTPYNARNTDDRKTSSTGSKPASTNTARTLKQKQSTRVEDVQPPGRQTRTNDAVRTAASGTFAPGPRPTSQVFLALCLRLVTTITNDERGDNQESTVDVFELRTNFEADNHQRLKQRDSVQSFGESNTYF